MLAVASAIPLDDRLNHIHERAVSAARTYHEAEVALLDALVAVERECVFVKLGYASLFAYAVEGLGLAEGVAYSAISVARKSCEVPALKTEIEQGNLSLSKAKKIASVITLENQSEWLEKAKTLTSKKLEKAVATENPRERTSERASYVDAHRLALSLGVEEKLMLELRRAQHQVSQSKGHSASLEETLGEIVAFYLKHKDPVEKAKRVIAKKGIRNPSVPVKTQFLRTVEEKITRTPVPAPIEHQVRLRDQGICQFRRSNGSICGARRWIDIHHIHPVSEGGSHELGNLITLCKAHHQEVHRAH